MIDAMWSITLIGVIVLVAIYVFRNVNTYVELREFGGHWSAGWSRLWLLRCHRSGNMHKKFTKINEEYGMYFLYLEQSSGHKTQLYDSSNMVTDEAVIELA
jgi:hypothetical protein